MFLMETLASWIEKKIKTRGWKPADLARRAGIPSSTLSRVLNETRNAGPDVCRRLARALNVPPEQILRQAGHLPPASPEIEQEEEAVHLLRGLTEQARSYAISILRALAGVQPAPANQVSEQRAAYHVDQSGTSTEQLAHEIVQQLDTMTPEDQTRVIDLMRRLSSERPDDRAVSEQ